MKQQEKRVSRFNILLWVAQGLLSATLLWSGSIKLFQPVNDLAAMWPWAGQVAPVLLRFTGIVDLLAAVGLILPMALNIKPKLTVYAAAGVVLLMLVASVFHIARGEASSIGINIVFAAIAAFIVWGRAIKKQRL